MIINPAAPLYCINSSSQQANLNQLVMQIGKNVHLPDETRNWTHFNFPLVDSILQYKEKAVPSILSLLSVTNDEKTVAEGLYIIDRMIENKVGCLENAYPVVARFNSTASPTIQVLLAGIYRKTQTPDAFGPLCKMLIRTAHQPNYPYFDSSEEIGGAILEYLRNTGAKNLYPDVFKTN